MVTLNVHFETFDDESFQRLESLAAKGPIAISIAPWQIPKIKGYQVKRLKEILSQDGYFLGQQGLNHKCKKCQDYHLEKRGKELLKPGIDPWHENYCLWFGEISAEKQARFMKQGRERLKKTFGIEPKLYVPPNHYFDRNTVRIAFSMRYKWLTDRALMPLKPYTLEGIIIVSEGEPKIDSDHVYIHADRWRGDLEAVSKKGFDSFISIKPKRNDAKKILENRKRKMIGKIARDLYKEFGMPEQNAKTAAELLYETKFSRDGFL